jgi:hypothetical protein
MSDDVIVFGLLVFYKVVTLAIGLGFAYMGYRLFMADKTGSAGDLQAKAGDYGLSLRGGAPGVFFSLFGTVLICISVFKGAEFKREPPKQLPSATIEKLVPDRPPFDNGN